MRLAALAIVCASYTAGAMFACGANAPAVDKAEASCLATYAPEIVQAFSAATPTGDAMGIVLSVEALACAQQALGVKVAVKRDAGATGG